MTNFLMLLLTCATLYSNNLYYEISDHSVEQTLESEEKIDSYDNELIETIKLSKADHNYISDSIELSKLILNYDYNWIQYVNSNGTNSKVFEFTVDNSNISKMIKNFNYEDISEDMEIVSVDGIEISGELAVVKVLEQLRKTVGEETIIKKYNWHYKCKKENGKWLIYECVEGVQNSIDIDNQNETVHNYLYDLFTCMDSILYSGIEINESPNSVSLLKFALRNSQFSFGTIDGAVYEEDYWYVPDEHIKEVVRNYFGREINNYAEVRNALVNESNLEYSNGYYQMHYASGESGSVIYVKNNLKLSDGFQILFVDEVSEIGEEYIASFMIVLRENPSTRVDLAQAA